MTETDLPISSPANANPEELLPRLGEYLLENHLISSEQLQAALDFQIKYSQANQGQRVLIGEALVHLGLIDSKVLDQAVATQLVSLHKALKEANLQLEHRIQLRTRDLEKRLTQIRAAADLTQFAVTASSLSELLQHTVNLVADRFGFHLVAIYLMDEEQKQLYLAEASGPYAPLLRQKNAKILVGSRSLAGWTAANNQSRVAADVRKDFFFGADDGKGEKDKKELDADSVRSEAAIPIAVQTGLIDQTLAMRTGQGHPDGNSAGQPEVSKSDLRVLGVLDVQIMNRPQDKDRVPLDSDTIAILEMIANHVAGVIQNLRLLDAACLSLNETNVLYRASQQINRSANENEIFQSLFNVLADIENPTQLLSAYVQPGEEAAAPGETSNELAVSGDVPPQKAAPRAVSRIEYTPNRALQAYLPGKEHAVFGAQAETAITIGMVDEVLPPSEPFLIMDLTQPLALPSPILELPKHLNCRVVALIPVRLHGNLQALVILGLVTNSLAAAYPLAGKLSFRNGGKESESVLRRDAAVQTCVAICDLASSALTRVVASDVKDKREAALEALNRISQFVTTRTNLYEFYKAIHFEVTRIIGEINFLIAIYNPATAYIEIPYLFEPAEDGNQVQHIDPFPLGAGLTSILINTHKPLMIVENMEQRARELGALTVGRPSLSWLGVPLMVSDEVIGAMIVQDPEHEHRFDDDDLQLMTTLGAQVAIAIRTTQLLENTRQQAERQRIINEITAKIRGSNNRQAIVETAAEEVRKALGAVRTKIEVGIKPMADDNAAGTPHN